MFIFYEKILKLCVIFVATKDTHVNGQRLKGKRSKQK